MSKQHQEQAARGKPARAPAQPTRRIGRWLLGGALPLALLFPTAASSQVPARTQAQGSWRGLDVPRYPRSADVRIEPDEDEYEIYFRSRDGVRAVFNYYRTFLQRQGFRVIRSVTKQNGFKADMVRGRGGPNGTIELDAKLKDGLHKVEIEFDE